MTEKPLMEIGSAVITDGQKVLMVRKPATARGPRICFPGGKVDAGEDAVTAACRETTEETGLTVTPVRVLGREEIRQRHVAVTYVIAQHTFGVGANLEPHKHTDVAWLSIPNALQELGNDVYPPLRQHLLDTFKAATPLLSLSPSRKGPTP